MQTQGSKLSEMQAQCDTENTRLIGHHDLDGSGDGMQVIKYGQYAYVAHVGKARWLYRFSMSPTRPIDDCSGKFPALQHSRHVRRYSRRRSA